MPPRGKKRPILGNIVTYIVVEPMRAARRRRRIVRRAENNYHPLGKHVMPQTLDINVTGNLLEVAVTGKLTREFYEEFVPTVENLIAEQGKIRVLFEMHDFHGWTAGALWEDIKFDIKHWRHIEQLAIVGETKWEHGMAVFCKPFTTAKVKYFDRADRDEARTWLEGA